MATSAEPPYTTAKTSVWWDIENCPPPPTRQPLAVDPNCSNSCDPHEIAHNIIRAIVNMGYKGPVSISAFGDTTRLSTSVQHALCSTGISLNHVPSGVKDADKKILVDMLFWAVDNPAPASFLLISEDRDFSNALHQLRMRKYNILLAQNYQPSPALLSAATSVWLWPTLVGGGSPLPCAAAAQPPPPPPPISHNNTNSHQHVLHPLPSPTTPYVDHKLSRSSSRGGKFKAVYVAKTPDKKPLITQPSVTSADVSQPSLPPPPLANTPKLLEKSPREVSTTGAQEPILPPSAVAECKQPSCPPPTPFFAHTQNTSSHHSSINGNCNPELVSFDSQHYIKQLPSTTFSSSSNIMQHFPSFSDVPRLQPPPLLVSEPKIPKKSPHEFFTSSASGPSRPPTDQPHSPLVSGSELYKKAPHKIFTDNATEYTTHDNVYTISPKSTGKLNYLAPPFTPNPHFSSITPLPLEPEASSFCSAPITDSHNVDKRFMCSSSSVNATRNSIGVLPKQPPQPSVEGHTGVILQALSTLEAEKMMPTKENITGCICYCDSNHVNNIKIKKALNCAIQQNMVVKVKIGKDWVYLGKNQKLWEFCDPDDGNIDQYPNPIWNTIHMFLTSEDGRLSIMSSRCRYEAALILKSKCLNCFPLGKVSQLLNMLITIKKWILRGKSGWLPVTIALP